MDTGTGGATASRYTEHEHTATCPADRPHLSTASTTRLVEPDLCTICLCPITARAVAWPCNHLTFDFPCLTSWLLANPVCPLCKSPVERVDYDWCSPTEYNTFRIPRPDGSAHGKRPAIDTRGTVDARHRVGGWRYTARSRSSYAPSRPTPGDPVQRPSENKSLSRRRAVYATGCVSRHVGTNRVSEYADFAPARFRNSPPLQSRARRFLRRELSIFGFLSVEQQQDGSGGGDNRRIEFLIEYIISMLKTLEIKGADGGFMRLLGEFLGSQRAHVLGHELLSWLRSPFEKLEDWDRNVQYALPELAWAGYLAVESRRESRPGLQSGSGSGPAT